MRTLNQILTDINNRIKADLSIPNVIYWNEATLQEKDDKTSPIVNLGTREGTQISPKEFNLQTYHRLIDSETETDPNGGFGKYPYRVRIYTLRNVWLGDLSSLSSQSYEFNDDVKNDVYAAFPVILDSKETVRTINEVTNKDQVLSEEFPGYELSNLNLELIAFYIEYQVRQKIRCA